MLAAPRPSSRIVAAGLLLFLGFLVTWTWSVRQRFSEARPTGLGGRPARAAGPAQAPATEPDLSPPPRGDEAQPMRDSPPAPVSAREEGFREAREVAWDLSLAGMVASEAVAAGGQSVLIEWVAAFDPGPAERQRLRQTGARRDAAGVWWGRKIVATDESGRFFVDGLPDVQVRIRAGGDIRISRPGSVVSLASENP